MLVTNGLVHFLLTKAFHGSSSLCFIFFCEKKDNLEWSKEMSLAESEGTAAFFQLCCEPALQPRAAQSISLVLRFQSVRWRWDDSWRLFQLPGNCTHKVAFLGNSNKSVCFINSWVYILLRNGYLSFFFPVRIINYPEITAVLWSYSESLNPLINLSNYYSAIISHNQFYIYFIFMCMQRLKLPNGTMDQVH